MQQLTKDPLFKVVSYFAGSGVSNCHPGMASSPVTIADVSSIIFFSKILSTLGTWNHIFYLFYCVNHFVYYSIKKWCINIC